MRTMFEDGLHKVAEGVTTLTEILEVTETIGQDSGVE